MKNDQTDKEKTGGNYPYHPLATCLPIADAVKALGGGKTQVSKTVLASSLKEDERSQTLAFKIASAKSFGLIEGRSNFFLTEAAKRYYFPTDESDKQNALLDFLESPPAFKKLIERFDGSKLQPNEILANILHREADVPQSWKDRVAVSFIKSAQFVLAIDEQGHLRVKASREGRASNQAPLNKDEQPAISTAPESQAGDPIRYRGVAGKLNSDSESGTFIESSGKIVKTAYIELPKDLSPDMWKWAFEWLQKRKPKEK